MAISFTQVPQLYTPAYNRNQFVAFSTLAAANNDFVYKVQILTPAGLLSYDYPKRPDNYGVFDAQDAVKNAIKHTFDPNIQLPTIRPGKSVEVNVTVSEYYGGTAYGQASYDYFAFDACLLLDSFLVYDFQDFVSGYTHPISFLALNLNNPYLPQRSVSLDNDVWFTFYLGACTDIDLDITDNLGMPVGTINYTISSPQPTEIYMFNAGNRSTTASGFPLQDGYSVAVTFYDTGGNTLYQTSFPISEKCTKYERYTVYYLKRNGAIGFFTFDKLSQSTLNKSTTQVRHSRMYLDSAEHYVYNTFDREDHVQTTIVTTSMTLNTDWITERQSSELEDLFSSPIVWISPPGGYNLNAANYIPVTITGKDYQVNKHVNQKLFNYNITVEYSQQEGRQRGV